MNLEPARMTEAGVNEDGDCLSHEIAVESRDAERIKSSEGETTART